MKKRILFFWLALILGIFSACRQQGKAAAENSGLRSEADAAAIKASFEEFVRLYNAADFDRIMSEFYAPNAVQMPPGKSALIGEEAIRLGFEKTRELGDEHCDRSVIEDIHISGDVAIVRGTDFGTTTPKGSGQPVKYSLKWLTVAERQFDGTWKWIDEIWNDNPLSDTPDRQDR